MSAELIRNSRAAILDTPPSDGGERPTCKHPPMHHSPDEKSGQVVNALTVDVEEYFQVTALSERIDRAAWQEYPSRVEENTEAVLQLLADGNVRATFFVLGWIAERFPQLVRQIAGEGHEIASHGMAHVRLPEQTAAEFRADVERTQSILADVSGTAIRGYRAASFSLTPDMTWAYEILGETGHHYSSSVYPMRHDIYGAPDAPRFSFRPIMELSITEIPITTLQIGQRRLPCGGGGYFRLLPYAYSRWGLKRINDRERQPAMVYFHPWEIDLAQPRVAGLSTRSRLRHYTNLKRMTPKLRLLLRDFAWDRIDRVFAQEIAS